MNQVLTQIKHANMYPIFYKLISFLHGEWQSFHLLSRQFTWSLLTLTFTLSFSTYHNSLILWILDTQDAEFKKIKLLFSSVFSDFWGSAAWANPSPWSIWWYYCMSSKCPEDAKQIATKCKWCKAVKGEGKIANTGKGNICNNTATFIHYLKTIPVKC